MTVIDCRDLPCPQPIIKIRMHTNLCMIGDQFQVLSNTPDFLREFQLFCRLADLTVQAETLEGSDVRWTLLLKPPTP